MYAELTKDSAIITIVDEELSESGESYRIVVRVLNELKWKKMIHNLLTASHESESFGLTVRQEFYLNDQSKPSFVWSILLLGDLDDAPEYLNPIFSKRGAPPAPPASLGISTPVARTAPARRTADGSVIKEVPLPFKRPASEDKDKVVNVMRDSGSDKKIRAFVDNKVGG